MVTTGAGVWVVPLAVAAGSNLDNLGVGVAYGIGRRRVGPRQNLLVATLTAACTAGAMSLGAAGSRLVPAGLAARAGGLVVVAVGLASVIGLWRAVPAGSRGRRRFPRSADDSTTAPTPVSFGEALVVGLGLSLNNLAAGIGAGVAGCSLPLTSASSGVLSFACLALGGRAWRLGRVGAGRGLARAGPVVAAVLLVAVGARMCIA